MKIKLEKDWQKITTEFTNSDVNLDQIFDSFKGMLVALGWTEQEIKNFIIEIAEDLTED